MSHTQTLAVISLVFLSSTCLTLYMIIIQSEQLLDGTRPLDFDRAVPPIKSPFLAEDLKHNISNYKDRNERNMLKLPVDYIPNHPEGDEFQRAIHAKSHAQIGRKTQSVYLNLVPHDPLDYSSDRQSPSGLDVYKSSFIQQYKSLSGSIWPGDTPTHNKDRILEQLHYASNMSSRFSSGYHPLKTILLHSTFDDAVTGQEVFQECPIRHCSLTRTNDHVEMSRADAVLLGQGVTDPFPAAMRRQQQVWIYYNLESPVHPEISEFTKPSLVNWTATYRSDSTIVTPYEKFVIFPNTTTVPTEPLRDYSAGKSNQVAWFVSNCNNHNGRLSYARELSLYISVHIYGNCGDRRCPRQREEECFHMLRKQYKFYLAFESANCRNYITEKFFRNALM